MNKAHLHRVNELLRLDAETGRLHWKVNRGNKSSAGDVAGSALGNRYMRMQIDGVHLSVHRVIWAIHYGHWPPDDKQIDHINGLKTDNRPLNLRLADNSQNQINSKVRNGTKSGLKGVDWIQRVGKWRAKIMVKRKNIHIGYYDDKESAHTAYCQKAAELHGAFVHPESILEIKAGVR